MVRCHFLMSPGTYLVSGSTFPPCMLNGSHLVEHFFGINFSSMCIPLQSLRNDCYATSSQQTPAFCAEENENYVCVILSVSSFHVEAWRNAMKISGVKEISNLRILLLYPHCPLNTKSCLFPEIEKAFRSIQKTKTLFNHVLGEVCFPFLPWELYLCAK